MKDAFPLPEHTYVSKRGPETTDLGEAEVFLHGMLKWDGCMSYSVGGSDYHAHACTREELIAVGELLAGIWDLGPIEMPATCDW